MKTEGRQKIEKAIMNKIQSIFDNANLIDEFEIYNAMQDKEFLRKTYGNTDVESILKKNYRFDILGDWREWKGEQE